MYIDKYENQDSRSKTNEQTWNTLKGKYRIRESIITVNITSQTMQINCSSVFAHALRHARRHATVSFINSVRNSLAARCARPEVVYYAEYFGQIDIYSPHVR